MIGRKGSPPSVQTVRTLTKHLLFSHRGQRWNRLGFGSFSVESSHRQPHIIPLLSFQVAAAVLLRLNGRISDVQLLNDSLHLWVCRFTPVSHKMTD